MASRSGVPKRPDDLEIGAIVRCSQSHRRLREQRPPEEPMRKAHRRPRQAGARAPRKATTRMAMPTRQGAFRGGNRGIPGQRSCDRATSLEALDEALPRAIPSSRLAFITRAFCLLYRVGHRIKGPFAATFDVNLMAVDYGSNDVARLFHRRNICQANGAS